jgi:peptide/nickel transport system permease protein
VSSITDSPSSMVPVHPDELETPPLSLGQLAWRRYRRHKMAIFGTVVIILIFLYCFGGMLVFSEGDSNFVDTGARLQPPSREHLFGTDTIGRDVMVRTIYGGQISIIIGILAVVVSVVVGVLIGAVAGYYGGIIDSLLMRFTEAMFNIPQLFLLIVLAKFFASQTPTFQFLGRTYSGSVVIIVGVIGLTSWMYLARIVRSSFLSLKEQEFVTAARATGAGDYSIIFEHILPSAMAPIIVTATLEVANAILSEAYISFLGMGVQPPTATWGNMLNEAYNQLEAAPWMWFFPGTLILLIVLAINFVGDGLRDALDPQSLAGGQE